MLAELCPPLSLFGVMVVLVFVATTLELITIVIAPSFSL
jgi:hypothetical protein